MEGTIQINGQQQLINGGAQVEFQFIRNSYPLDDKLYCYYTIPTNGSCQPQVGDWIGIYKVGWTGLEEVKCKKMITLEEYSFNPENGCGHVVFESYMLPKNPEQFYQFVYIKNGEVIRGASKPFLFEETSFIGQQQNMTENWRQQKEIRRQIERIMTQRGSWSQQQPQQPTLPQLIAQLRQNEERIANIKQQFNELRGVCGSQSVNGGKWIQWPCNNEYTTEFGNTTTTTGTTTMVTGNINMPTTTGITTGTTTTTTTTHVPTTWTTYGKQGQRQSLQELQQGLQNLKLGLQELRQESTYPLPRYQPLNVETSLFTTGEWPQQLPVQIERRLVEQQRREQEHRMREQLLIHAQIKSCVRALAQQERRAVRQRQYDEQCVQQQVAQFAHKLSQCSGDDQQQVARQVARFESLLRERLALEAERKQRMHQHIQQRLRECEQKIREHQQCEYQFMGRHHQQLQQRVLGFQQQLVALCQSPRGIVVSPVQQHQQVQQYLRDLECAWIEQQRQEHENMRQNLRTYQRIVDEIECELVEAECEQQLQEVYGGVYYNNYNGARKPHQPFDMYRNVPNKYQSKFQTKGFFYKQQLQQLEQQIGEFKRMLKVKSVQSVFEKMGFVNGQEWNRPLVQRLREFELCLKSELNGMETCEMPVKGVHIERMLNRVSQQIGFLETPYEVQHFVEESRCKLFVQQLQQLECALGEFQQRCPTFVNTTPVWTNKQQKRVLKELIAELQHGVQMKIKSFGELIQLVEMPCEDNNSWKQIRQLEQQLHAMKQLDITIEHSEFKQLLGEFGQQVACIGKYTTTTVFVNVKSILACQEQLYQLICDVQYFWAQYKQLFARGYLQQQENVQYYKQLCKLVGIIEYHLIKFQTQCQANQVNWTTQEQYPIVLKKQLQLFNLIQTIKYNLPYEQQELVSILVKQRVQTFVQDCERYLPADFEVYQPLHRQIKNLIQSIKTLECPTGEEQQMFYGGEVKQVLKHHFKMLRQLHQQVRECEGFFFENSPSLYTPQREQYHYFLKQQIQQLGQFIQNYMQVICNGEDEENVVYYPIGGNSGLTCDLTGDFDFNGNNVFTVGNGIQNTIFTTPFTHEQFVEIVSRFGVMRPIEQQNIVCELVQRYISCLIGKQQQLPFTCDFDFRKKFEQLYVDNTTKLAYHLRNKLNEVAECQKHIEELQTAKAYLQMKYIQQCKQQQQQYNGIYNGEYNYNFGGEYESQQPRISITVLSPVEEEQYYSRPSTKQIVNELEYSLNKMRIQQKENNTTEVPTWFVKSPSGYELGPNTIIPSECYRSVEGNLLVKLPQQQQQQQYPGSEEIICQLQKKINKLVNQQGLIECVQEQYTICPVCDISLSKEIAQPEFELHVNSHFTD